MTTSVYTKAVSLGYPYRWGEGRPTTDNRVWLTRFQKTNEPNDVDIVFVGWDELNRTWVVEHD